MEVYNGAPAESRSDVENRVYAALAQLEIPFTRVDHEPAFTMEDCAAISEALDVHICKNLLLTPRNRSAFYLLCLPAENSFPQRIFQADRLLPPELRHGGGSGGAAGLPRRFRVCAGSDERHGAPGHPGH